MVAELAEETKRICEAARGLQETFDTHVSKWKALPFFPPSHPINVERSRLSLAFPLQGEGAMVPKLDELVLGRIQNTRERAQLFEIRSCILKHVDLMKQATDRLAPAPS